MIYLSFIGNHDKILNQKDYGAFSNIFNEYKSEIDKVFMLITPASESANYSEIAKENIKLIKSLKESVEVIPINVDLSNPIDYDLVYPKMLDTLVSIIEENKLDKSEKIINITSGTPTMTACWLLLAQSGLIKNTRLIQSFEKKYSRKGKTVQEIDFNIDDFPTIKAPSALKRQLTITSRENKELKSRITLEELDKRVPDLIGTSKHIREIKDQLINDINANTHVLILGERGTGKEIIAHAIWKLYHKPQDQKLTAIDCGALPKELIQSELFGHKKGAFTGADSDREGILHSTKNKMIFLDEIGNLPIEGQQKLLRVLSHGEVRKVGSNDVEKISIQIISATNKNVEDSTLFAQDIKDRFDEILLLPPLRERREDIPQLIEYFLKIYSTDVKTLSPIQFEKALIKKLVNYDWPGNVRELELWVKRVVRRFKDGGLIKLTDLPERFVADMISDESADICLPELPLSVNIDAYTEMIRNKARDLSNGNMSEVDRLLNQKVGTEKQRQYRIRKS